MLSAEIEPEITLVLFLYLPKYSPLPKVGYSPLLYIPYYIPFSISKTLKGFSDKFLKNNLKSAIIIELSVADFIFLNRCRKSEKPSNKKNGFAPKKNIARYI